MIGSSVVMDTVNSSFSGFSESDSCCTVHIRRVQNVLADSLFRVTILWSLDERFFQWIFLLGIKPHVNFMATPLNNCFPTYVSLSEAVYLFPPNKALLAVLNYLPHYKGKVVLVASFVG